MSCIKNKFKISLDRSKAVSVMSPTEEPAELQHSVFVLQEAALGLRINNHNVTGG